MQKILDAKSDPDIPVSAGLKSNLYLRTPPREGSLIDFRIPETPENLQYFHGTLSKEEVDTRLPNRGDFLLRRDPTDGALVLSFRSTGDRSMIDLVLKEDSSGRFSLPSVEREGGQPDRTQFVTSVEEFICYFYVYKYPLLESFILNPVKP